MAPRGVFQAACGFDCPGKLTTRTDHGEVSVNSQLNVHGYRHIYAIGDITNLAETKMAGYAGQHAAVVAENIRAQIDGNMPEATYQPLGYPMILLPLGTQRGVGQLPSPNGPTAAPPKSSPNTRAPTSSPAASPNSSASKNRTIRYPAAGTPGSAAGRLTATPGTPEIMLSGLGRCGPSTSAASRHVGTCSTRVYSTTIGRLNRPGLSVRKL